MRTGIRQGPCIAMGLLVAAGAHAQPSQATEELKAQLEQALKVIRDLQDRVNALEQQRVATPGTPAAPGVAVPRPAVEGAPVIAPNAVAEKGAEDSGKVVPTTQTDLLLFHSRRIGLSEQGREVPIIAGAKLAGKIGEQFTVGALNVQTDRSDNLPGSNYGVFQIRRKTNTSSAQTRKSQSSS